MPEPARLLHRAHYSLLPPAGPAGPGKGGLKEGAGVLDAQLEAQVAYALGRDAQGQMADDLLPPGQVRRGAARRGGARMHACMHVHGMAAPCVAAQRGGGVARSDRRDGDGAQALVPVGGCCRQRRACHERDKDARHHPLLPAPYSPPPFCVCVLCTCACLLTRIFFRSLPPRRSCASGCKRPRRNC